LLDSAPDGVVIVDATGLIRLVNRQAEAMFGYAREELLGQPIEVLVPDRAGIDHREHRDGYVAHPTGRPMGAGLDLAARRKDGSEFPVDISLSSLQTDDGLLVSAAVRDSSERKQIEAKIQELEATSRLAAIVESSHDAIIGKTLDGVITSWNAAAERVYGYTATEIIGRNIAALVPGDRAGELTPILGRVRLGERVEHYETQRVAKDGSRLDISLTISPIRDSRGLVMGVSSVTHDMTETKQADTDHRALEAQLQQAQRLESIGQLAGGIAHDFNNLLAGIMNYAGLASTSLQDEMARCGLDNDTAFVTVVEDVDEVTKVAKRAAELTRQLLIFSHRTVAQPEVLDLNALVGDMEQLLRRTIGENVDHLRTVFAADLPKIKADRGQIEQVVMNLAVNARDAMPDGGELEIATAPFEVDADHAHRRAIRTGSYARLTVSDTGTGMSDEVAARMFEPFFTTKPTGQGTGLGLATVYGIVTQAGGDITIDSTVGGGTTIRVDLPATSEAEAQPRGARPDVPLSARGETVLLVEDEDIVRDPVGRMLTRHGYTVLTADGADAAMVIVNEHPDTIDLLLTDVVMPGRSGKELSVVVSRLRPATKVLFMSGYSKDVIGHQGVLEQGVNLIEKPFSAEDLLRKARNVLDDDS
jgi:hypothetical protein